MKVTEVTKLEDGSELLTLDFYDEYEYYRLLKLGHQVSCYSEYDEDKCIELGVEYVIMTYLLENNS